MRFATGKHQRRTEGQVCDNMNIIPQQRPEVAHEVLDWSLVGYIAHRFLVLAWQRRMLVLIICLSAVALTGAANWWRGPRFTADLLILPNLNGRQNPPKMISPPSIDASILVESEVQVLRSEALVRSVVQLLRQDDNTRRAPWFAKLFDNSKSGTLPNSAISTDLAVKTISRNLIVVREKGSYIIRVSYTAATAEAAATVVRGVANEYIRLGWMQEMADRVRVAEMALNELTQNYGERHPLVLRARDASANARRQLESEQQRSKALTESELTATGLIVPAQAIGIPSSATTIDMAFSGLLVGLLIAAGTVYWFERKTLIVLYGKKKALLSRCVEAREEGTRLSD
jgi:uncharacterized protein involved in exopolysaccharide biosynthesis